MFARRAAAEVPARHEDGTTRCVGPVQDEVGPRLAVAIESEVEKCLVAEAVA